MNNTDTTPAAATAAVASPRPLAALLDTLAELGLTEPIGITTVRAGNGDNHRLHISSRPAFLAYASLLDPTVITATRHLNGTTYTFLARQGYQVDYLDTAAHGLFAMGTVTLDKIREDADPFDTSHIPLP